MRCPAVRAELIPQTNISDAQAVSGVPASGHQSHEFWREFTACCVGGPIVSQGSTITWWRQGNNAENGKTSTPVVTSLQGVLVPRGLQHFTCCSWGCCLSTRAGPAPLQVRKGRRWPTDSTGKPEAAGWGTARCSRHWHCLGSEWEITAIPAHRHAQTGRKFLPSSTRNVVSAEGCVAQILLVPSARITTWIRNEERSSARPREFHRQPPCLPAPSERTTLAGPSSVPVASLEGKGHHKPGICSQHRPVGLLLPLWGHSWSQSRHERTHTGEG